MKNKYLYILPVFLMLFASCNDLLDIDPTSQYSTDTFWSGSDEQYAAALVGVYNSLMSNYLYFNGELEQATPNEISYNSANGTREIALGTALSTSSMFSSCWANSYKGIGRANTFLDYIDDADITDEDTKNQMKGEALFIRALLYSYLVDYFGDVPLILEAPASEQETWPRTAKDEVVEQILSDLDDAASLLPTSYSSSSDIGRATQGAALALKARVLLYNERWAEAATAAKTVIDLGVYDLFPDYRGFYLPDNENNEEVIFDVQYQSPDFLHRRDYECYNLNRWAPLKNLVDLYEMTDGKSIDESELYDPENPYENRDPRLHQTIAIVGYPYNGKTATSSLLYESGYGLKKLTVYTDDETQTISDNNSDLNYIVLRYGEVLLTYAEALNESLSAPNSEVYWAINTIRGRETVEMPELEAGLTKEEMREAIHLERRIELVGEGQFYSDFRRWGTAEELNNGPVYNYLGEVIETRSFNPDRDYLFAVPSSEIDENENLTQNPGW
ncbi:RagB/SusD family nutrient uptake outer membrane protein [Mangrovibacterium diazotrophicum]|uniref:Putative outer membrane starch-binding protein n=1 Tax=Mangrovibacterium diazotrophicum TaxID=1261403 RepID=A0A419VX67_9BACT|nr:RagB/SusD family nutrient uptake outer membrane protein [Mangrovibacterium diazotrophicum]RKD87823.1 putative outer membrane starch-binding protein [Mangrovibacterium diazotrophicum]